jgi:hypothetical protein
MASSWATVRPKRRNGHLSPEGFQAILETLSHEQILSTLTDALHNPSQFSVLQDIFASVIPTSGSNSELNTNLTRTPNLVSNHRTLHPTNSNPLRFSSRTKLRAKHVEHHRRSRSLGEQTLFRTPVRFPDDTIQRSGIPSLHSILQDVILCVAFRKYLTAHFCEENLSFWKEIKLFHRAPPEDLIAEADKIYFAYIRIDSRQQINIPNSDRSVLEQIFEPPSGQSDRSKITRSVFDQCALVVFDLLKASHYYPFIEHEFYTSA